MKSLSRVQLLATPWTAAYQAPPFMGLSRQEYWSGLPLLPLLHSIYVCSYTVLVFFFLIYLTLYNRLQFHPLVQCVVRKLSLYFVQYSYLSRELTEKAMAPHSSTLAWKIPWTEEPGGLQSMGLRRVDTTERFHFHFYALEKEMATHSSVLAWRIPGMGKPGGLPSMGSHRVRHD